MLEIVIQLCADVLGRSYPQVDEVPGNGRLSSTLLILP